MAMCGFLPRANRCTMVKASDNFSPQVTIASYSSLREWISRARRAPFRPARSRSRAIQQGLVPDRRELFVEYIAPPGSLPRWVTRALSPGARSPQEREGNSVHPWNFSNNGGRAPHVCVR